jgi:hypothetical protein
VVVAFQEKEKKDGFLLYERRNRLCPVTDAYGDDSVAAVAGSSSPLFGFDVSHQAAVMEVCFETFDQPVGQLNNFIYFLHI